MKENKDNKGIKENTKVSTSGESSSPIDYQKYINALTLEKLSKASTSNLPGNDR